MNSEETEHNRAIASVIINVWKAVFLKRIADPWVIPSFPLKPPGIANPAVKATVAMSAATITWVLKYFL